MGVAGRNHLGMVPEAAGYIAHVEIVHRFVVGIRGCVRGEMVRRDKGDWGQNDWDES